MADEKFPGKADETDSQENVVHIKKRRKSKDNKEEPEEVLKKKKPTYAQLYDDLKEDINHGSTTIHPPFPETFLTMEVDTGIRTVLKEGPGEVVSAVSPAAVLCSLMNYTQGPLFGLAEYHFTTDHGRGAVDYWLHSTKPIERPPYVRFASDPGRCWHRLPFDPQEDHDEKHVPTWGKLLQRIGDVDARMGTMAWIGSLFFKESYRQQYLWIYGPGGDGKGALGRFIHKLFNGAAHFISAIPRDPNQFWTAQFLNKRVIAFPDCEAHHFPASGLFKTLTGGDPVSIERKKKDPFTTLLDCKFFFTSNQLPSLSSEAADMRRPIFAKMEGEAVFDPDFEDKLWAEAPWFVWFCMDTYRQYCPNHGPIPVKNTDMKDWVDILEDPHLDVFTRRFRVSLGGTTNPTQMQQVLREEFPKRHMQLEFLKWLQRKHGIKKKTLADDSKAYCGITKINHFIETQ